MTSSSTLGAAASAAVAAPMPGVAAPAAADDGRYSGREGRLRGRISPPSAEVPPAPDPNAPADQSGSSTNNVITLVCRAVNLTSLDPSANTEFAFAVQNEIKASPMVDAEATQLSPQLTPDDSNGTFTFTVNVVLRNPLNF
jgi:hypothetical protein